MADPRSRVRALSGRFKWKFRTQVAFRALQAGQIRVALIVLLLPEGWQASYEE